MASSSLTHEPSTSIFSIAVAYRRSKTLLFSVICNSCIASLLLLQIALSFLVLQLIKRLPLGRICSYTSHRHRQHAVFKLGPFVLSSDLVTDQPIRKSDTERHADSAETRSRFAIKGSHNSLRRIESTPSLLSAEASPSISLLECELHDDHHKVKFPSQGISAGTSLVYRRRRSGNRTRSRNDDIDGSSETNRASSEVVTEEDEASATVLLSQRSSVGWSCSTVSQNAYGRSQALDMNDAIAENSHRQCFFQQGHRCDLVLQLVHALQSEHEKLCIVYSELEEERAAAETAANETMSMILRLQEEKSVLQREAAHNRRMAEEKAFHDEQFIQVLKEALSVKETECNLLVEQLQKIADQGSASPCFFSHQNRQRLPLSESQEMLVPEIQQVTRSTCSEQAICPRIAEEVDSNMGTRWAVSEDTSSSSCIEEENVYASSVLLMKLSALEKRMETLSARESKNLGLVATAEEDSFTGENDAESCAEVPSFDSECSGCNGEEEKVVNVDMAAAAAEEEEGICKVENSWKKKKNEYCDIPYPIIGNNLQKTGKHHLLLSLSHPTNDHTVPPQVYEAMNWRMKKVTLEDIDLRLQILENQILLLRQQAVPSNHEQQVNMNSLKQMLQELYSLLQQAN